jgi:hypothetical protein
MNWEAIAAIGEVVGALGVIASLGTSQSRFVRTLSRSARTSRWAR